MEKKKLFDDIFRQYYSQLYHFARQYLADEDTCHDVVSAVFEDVWRNFSHIQLNSVRSFLYTCTKNKCIDVLRRDKKRQQYIDFVTIMGDSYTSDEALAEKEHRDRVVRLMLEQIPPKTREILMKCYVEQKKYREVAEELDMSVANVKKHMVKALKLLRDLKNAKKNNLN